MPQIHRRGDGRSRRFHGQPPLRSSSRRWLATLLVAIALAVAPRAQQQQPAPEPPVDLPPVTFHTEVTSIEVDVFVTDRDDRPVTDLTIDDFELFEDNVRQTIQSFSSVNLPVERRERPLYASRPVQPDVRTNVGEDGRIYLILLDDVHLHPQYVPRMRLMLQQFIERDFGSNDVAAVLRVRGGSGDSQDFTSNPDLLLRAINRFTGSFTRESFEGLSGGPSAGPTGGATPDQLLEAHEARDVVSRIRELSEFLAGVRGRRKTLLFVSQGSPFDMYESTGQLGSIAALVREDLQRAAAAASRGNVAIYTLDPRGLVAEGNARLSQAFMREVAIETGGFAAVNTNNFEGAFERIVRENSNYYLLRYTPSNDARDGKYRRLRVRVRRPDVQVRFRNGYTAPTATDDAAPAPVRSAAAEALASPLASGQIPIAVFASAYRGTDQRALVTMALEVDATQLAFIERDGTFHEQVEVLHTATSSRGEVHAGLKHDMVLRLERATYERAQAAGVRLLMQAELPPGRYQLRVAAASATTGQAGSVVYDLEVPDFTARGLTMSGLAIGSSSAARTVTIADRRLALLLPNSVTTTRTFAGDETLSVFGELYSNERGAAHTVEIVTELRGDTGQVSRRSTETRSSAELGDDGAGYGFSAAIPLSGLDPGLYVINVTARSSLHDEPVSRDVPIRVQ